MVRVEVAVERHEPADRTVRRRRLERRSGRRLDTDHDAAAVALHRGVDRRAAAPTGPIGVIATPEPSAASRIGASSGGSPSATTITFIDLTSPIRILFSP